DLYIKVGASGTGSWTLTTILHTVISGLAASSVAAQVTSQVNPQVATATAAATLAGHYANDSTNVDVPGGTAGDRGAKYWSTQAAASAASIPAGAATNINDLLAGVGREPLWPDPFFASMSIGTPLRNAAGVRVANLP